MQPTNTSPTLESAPPVKLKRIRGGRLLVGLALMHGIMLVGIKSVPALAIAVLDGGISLLVLGSAGLAGGWIVRALKLGSRPDRLVLGAGLGIGLLSLIVLGLGVAGWMNRPVAIGLVVILGLSGTVRLLTELDIEGFTKPTREDVERPQTTPSAERIGPWGLIGPFIGLFLAIAIAGAALPPGILWAEEGNGYDVLEYHLAAPSEWHEAGRITFLDHNVYSNMPMAGAMLSLLMMTLHGDPIEAAFMATFVNVVLALLLVAVAWRAGSLFSRSAGLAASVVMATCPWIAYLSAVAFVEIGMLAMGMCSLVAIIHAEREDRSAWRWLLVAGWLAGLSCGFKYTAVVMIAIPMGGLALFYRKPWSERVKGLVIFAAATLVTFSPWLIRSVAHTGNPVFPLAYSVFGADERCWDAELDARWRAAHGALGAGDLEAPTPTRLIQRTLADFRLGPVIVLLAFAGAFMRRDRWSIGLAGVLVWQVLIWAFATHQLARFAVVLLVPLTVMSSWLFARPPRRWIPRVAVVVIIAGATWQLYRLGTLYYHHVPENSPDAYGRTNWFETGQWPGTGHFGAINGLDDASYVMLVGEARGFYLRRAFEYATVFNRHPLAEAAGRLRDAERVMEWLRDRGTTHVLVHWSEMKRLRGSYGFYPEIDADLFGRLEKAGLREIESFAVPLPGAPQGYSPPYATLYEVVGHE